MINIQGTKKAGIPRLFHRCVMLPLLYIVLRARALHVLLRLFHAGGYAALHRRAGDEVVAERREDARDRHRRLEHGPDHAARRRGRPSAMRNEKPTMSTLRWLPMSARMRFWMPSAPIVPKSVMYAPPMTGVGIVAMRAPSLPMSERQISITAPARTT